MRFLLPFVLSLVISTASLSQDSSYGYLILNFKNDSAFFSFENNSSNYIFIKSGDTLKVPEGELNYTLIPSVSKTRKGVIYIEKDTYNVVTYIYNREFEVYSEKSFLNTDFYFIKNGVEAAILTDFDSDIEIKSITTDQNNQIIADFEIKNNEVVTRWSTKLDTDKYYYFDKKLKPSRNKLYLKSILPGFGHMYKYEKEKGVILFSTFSASFLIHSLVLKKYSKEKNTFDSKLLEYRAETDISRATELGIFLNKQEKTVNFQKKLLIGSTTFTSLLYLYSFFDGIKEPRIGFRTSKGMLFNFSINEDAVNLVGKIPIK